MSGVKGKKLTQGVVNAAKPAEKEYFVWCAVARGFGLRVSPVTAKSPAGRRQYVAQARMVDGSGLRRVNLGSADALSMDDAKKLFEETMAAIKAGRDPQAERREKIEAPTVSELCWMYLEAAKAGQVLTRFGRQKKASTLAIDIGRVERHVVKLLGDKKAALVTRGDAQRMVDAIAAGKTSGEFKAGHRGLARVTGGAGTAARVGSLMGGIWTWAMQRELVPGPNPFHRLQTAKGEAGHRVLSAAEYAALGSALDAASEAWKAHEAMADVARAAGKRPPRPPAGLVSPGAITCLRLVALSGLRKSEAMGLKWDEVDIAGHCLRLADSKTGRSRRVLGQVAVTLLDLHPRMDDTFVFPATRGDGPADFKKSFGVLLESAGLSDVSPHDLRRSFATVADGEELSDGTVQELLGHAGRGVTERHYIRRPDAGIIAAADRVAARIEAMMRGGATVVELTQRGSVKRKGK